MCGSLRISVQWKIPMKSRGWPGCPWAATPSFHFSNQGLSAKRLGRCVRGADDVTLKPRSPSEVLILILMAFACYESQLQRIQLLPRSLDLVGQETRNWFLSLPCLKCPECGVNQRTWVKPVSFKMISLGRASNMFKHLRIAEVYAWMNHPGRPTATTSYEPRQHQRPTCLATDCRDAGCLGSRQYWASDGHQL